MSEKPLLRDPRLHMIFSVTLMSVLGVSSITPAFPLIAERLNLTAGQVGWLVTAFTLPGVALTPVFGIVADRIGRKRVLVPSLILFALAGASCTLAGDMRALVILRFFQGIGAAALGSLNLTLIGDIYEHERRITAMGYNSSVLSVGAASYPTIGGALAALGWRVPFALPLVALPVALWVVLKLDDTKPTGQQTLRTYLADAWRSLRDWRLLGILSLSAMVFIIVYGAYLSYLPFLLRERFAASTVTIGLVMSSMSLTAAFTASRLGALTRRYSRGTLLRVACGATVVGMAGISVVPTLGLLILPIMLYGVAQGLNVPTLQTLVATLAPPQQRAVFMSLNGAVFRLGQTLGPLLMGAMYVAGGVTPVFLLAAGVAAIMFVLSLALVR